MNDALAAEVEAWRDALASLPSPPERLIVLDEVDSTMDAARDEPPGTTVFALRQRRGRGRLGRRWHDEEPTGIAMTAVFAAPEARFAARLGLAAAVGVAEAVESFLPHSSTASRRLGIKWPNDVMVDDRKIAGVLVERVDDRALVGIGLNVLQSAFPPEIEARATSLRRVVASAPSPTRASAAAALWRGVAEASALPEATLLPAWRRRDWLSGRRATFRHGEEVLAGRVVAIEPLESIELRIEDGAATASTRRLDVARSEVLEVSAADWTSPPDRTDQPV